MSIIDIRKTLMYRFWYDHIKPKCQNNAKLCFMNTVSLNIHTETEEFYKDIADEVEKRYHTSNYEVGRPLPKGMNKNVIDLVKDKLGEKIITEFVVLGPKKYSYVTLDDKNVKKTKGTKKCVIKRIFKFDDYKDCLFKNKIILKSQRKFIKRKHIVYILKKSRILH